MFDVVSTILYVAVVLIALLLICLVLIQPSKGGGFGSAFGGIGESVFGAQAMSQLSKFTVVMLTLFFVLTLVLAIMTGHRTKTAAATEGSVVTEAKAEPAKTEKTAEKDPAGSAEEASAAKPGAPAPVKTLSAKPAAKAPEAKAAPAKPAAKAPEAKAGPAKAEKPAAKDPAKPAAKPADKK